MIRLHTSIFLVAFILSATVLAGQHQSSTEDKNRLELGTGISGEVKTITVKVGDRVKRGDLLLTLDDTPFKAGIKLIKADLGWRKAKMKEAEREYQRNQELYDDGSLSTVDLNLSKIAFDKASAQYSKQRSRQTLAEYRLRQSRIEAPADGVVIAIYSFPGQRVVVEKQAQTLLVIEIGGLESLPVF